MSKKSYEISFLRPEIKNFAINMEIEMRKKDELGYTNNDKSTQLHEERNEVDECSIDNNIDKFINEESLHEGIMLALLRYRLKEKQKWKYKQELEKEYFKSKEQYEHMKGSSTKIENLIRKAERIKILEWVLSDLNKDLDKE